MNLPLHGSLITHTEILLKEVLRFAAPADGVISRYFKQNSNLGHRDRGTIAEAIYAVLRQKLEFAHFAQSTTGPIERRLGLLGLSFVVGIPAVAQRVGPHEAAWLDHIRTIDRGSLPFEMRCNLPEWILSRLRTRFADDEVEALANGLNRPAPLDLRANTQKITRDQAIEVLRIEGFEAESTRFSPDCIRMADKPALSRLAIFNDGAIEVQDEGSQILARLVAPKRGELVIDFCAGAGGKTLALGALMRSTGRLYALDISAKRLTNFKPRLSRSGLSNVHPMVLDNERDARLKRFVGKANRVLVDAPCSGLGTLRRNPDLKWRQSPEAVAQLVLQQRAILSSAARLVAPGGRLVYATCSLLDEENQSLVASFLSDHEQFERHSVAEILAQQGIDGCGTDVLELWPHRHGTDGFFAVALGRRAAT